MKPLNKYKIAVVICLFGMFISGCEKETPPVVIYPEFPHPNWEVSPDNGFSVSMTAVVKLNKALVADFRAEDPVGAFAGEECRGIGQVVRDSLIFISIHGKPDETLNIQFRYYSTLTKHMFITEPNLPFIPNESYGSTENPVELDLKIVEK